MGEPQPAMTENTIDTAPEEYAFISDLKTMPDDIAREYYDNLRSEGNLTDIQARTFIRAVDDYRNGIISKDAATESIAVICGDIKDAIKIVNSVPTFRD